MNKKRLDVYKKFNQILKRFFEERIHIFFYKRTVKSEIISHPTFETNFRSTSKVKSELLIVRNVRSSRARQSLGALTAKPR